MLAVPTPAASPNPTDFTVESLGERLIVTRLKYLHSPLEVGEVQHAIQRAIRALSTKVVIGSDWRNVDIFAPAVADAVLGMLNVTNQQVQRGGILLGAENAVFSLQVERVLRGAGNSGRKCFRDSAKLLGWLAEALDASEREHAARFLLAD